MHIHAQQTHNKASPCTRNKLVFDSAFWHTIVCLFLGIVVVLATPLDRCELCGEEDILGADMARLACKHDFCYGCLGAMVTLHVVEGQVGRDGWMGVLAEPGVLMWNKFFCATTKKQATLVFQLPMQTWNLMWTVN